MDDFLANNVNAYFGDILLCDTYVPNLYPTLVPVVQEGRRAFSFSAEACHIDQLGFKLTTVFRLRKIKSLRVLTKDGSPHSLQIPLIVQEAAQNSDFPADQVEFYVVEKERVCQISHKSVRLARHLSEIESLMGEVHTSPSKALLPSRNGAQHSLLIPILVGGRSDVEKLRGSGLLEILEQAGLEYEVSVISSEQNPEDLRQYCHQIRHARIPVVICIAGLVPGLPAATKAHLPMIPIIAVPLSSPAFDAKDILMGSLCLPARRPVILTGIDDTGLRKAGHLVREIVAATNTSLREHLAHTIQHETPKPDLRIASSRASNNDPSTTAPLNGTKAHLNGSDPHPNGSHQAVK